MRLCNDILNAGKKTERESYFIGSIVAVAQKPAEMGKQSPYLVIDGQQRLTTVSLLLAAFVEVTKTEAEYTDVSQNIKCDYLISEREKDDKRYKLLLSRKDRVAFINIINGVKHEDDSSLVVQNYEWIKKWLHGKIDQLGFIWQGLIKLDVVGVTLFNDVDDPQLVFESMNSTGEDLSQSDLIRNYMLMNLNVEEQEKLYNDYWKYMEQLFGASTDVKDFDRLIRHYLTIKMGEIPKIENVYKVFKALFSRDKEELGEWKREHVIAEVKQYAKYFTTLDRIEKTEKDETEKNLRAVLIDLKVLDMDVVYPLLLELYRYYDEKKISQTDFIKLARYIESYLFRRSVCGLSSNYLNKIFPAIVRNLTHDNIMESIESKFLLLQKGERFPSDEEFNQKFKEKDLYNFRNRKYWLRKLENCDRESEFVDPDDYTIEHIMPQNENLCQAWRDDLGENWKAIQSRWLHTAGNLTLTGYNAKLSDRPFREKRDIENGFKDSPIKLNAYLRQIDVWNEDAIKERAEQLANLAIKAWKAPYLSPNVLEQYKPKKNKIKKQYSIDDHPVLLKDPMRSLFKKLRQEILSLDSSIKEEYLKLYVAYKVDTNFADIIPQAKGLKIILNMPFDELDDPKGICKDVSKIGKYGNGNIRFVLASSDQLPYAIGLIRQSLDRQIANPSQTVR